MDGLTLQQRKVVEAGGGAWLVLAGAGTGKTRALVHRVARLLALGVAPSRVCLVTFSQRAAANMRAQLEALGVAEGVRAGTFHALALEALRRRGGALGWSGAFSVLGEVEATRAMQGCAERVGLGGHGAKVARLQEQCAQRGWDVAQGVEALWPEARGLEGALWGAFDAYARWKAEARALDFGDLLLGWSRLLELGEGDEVEHVLVDEFQDVNPLQARLVEQLARPHGNVMVVGDDAQAIYGFRGASAGEILGFPARCEGRCGVLRLEENFRGTAALVGLANAALPPSSVPKRLRAAREVLGARPGWWLCRDEGQEARFVAERILGLRDEGVGWGEVAVLARSHRRLREVERALTERGVPWVRRSGGGRLDASPVREVLAWMRWCFNPRDQDSAQNAARALPHVGPTWAARLAQEAAARGSVPEALRAVLLPKAARGPALRAADCFEAARTPSQLLEAAILLQETTGGAGGDVSPPRLEPDPTQGQLQTLEALRRWAERAGDVGEFLHGVALWGGSEAELWGEGEPAVQLSTVHRAKGLEWGVVFVVGLAEGFFPTWWSLDEGEGLEEEARVFHVAVTRAQQQLYMTTPTLGRDAEGRLSGLRPSRFVEGLAQAGWLERGVVRG